MLRGIGRVQPSISRYVSCSVRLHFTSPHLELGSQQRRVREAVFRLMRREPDTPLTPLHMPTTFEVTLYERTRNPADGPNLEPLRIDVANPSLASRWNKRVAEFVSSELCNERGSSNLDPKAVAKHVKTHLVALRRQYIQELQSIGNQGDQLDKSDRNSKLSRITRHRAVSSVPSPSHRAASHQH